MNDYPDAGKNAQAGVKADVERFRKEGIEDRILLWWLLGSGTPPYKMDKKDAAYQQTPKGEQRCGNCEFAWRKVYLVESGGDNLDICSQVRGRIKVGHWCRFWKNGSS